MYLRGKAPLDPSQYCGSRGWEVINCKLILINSEHVFLTMTHLELKQKSCQPIFLTLIFYNLKTLNLKNNWVNKLIQRSKNLTLWKEGCLPPKQTCNTDFNQTLCYSTFVYILMGIASFNNKKVKFNGS